MHFIQRPREGLQPFDVRLQFPELRLGATPRQQRVKTILQSSSRDPDLAHVY